MIKYKHNVFNLVFSILLAGLFNPAQAFSDSDCRPLQLDKDQQIEPGQYTKGLLWKVSKKDLAPSYVFGTIHVSDESILSLPEQVSASLQESERFVMEALPEPDELVALAQTMFFTDGQTLHSMVSQAIYDRTVQILGAYQMPPNAVSIMKPWAAFLTMSYPAEPGLVLDLVLLEQAKKNGASVYGLESLGEQGEIFEQMSLQHQLVLLKDTVCHYETVMDDIDKMKSLYLQRDLVGLFQYAQGYGFADNSAYEALMARLLTERNYTMTERMQPMLRKGKAFIAVGAMHLAGEEGILSLLAKEGYEVTSVY